MQAPPQTQWPLHIFEAFDTACGGGAKAQGVKSEGGLCPTRLACDSEKALQDSRLLICKTGY